MDPKWQEICNQFLKATSYSKDDEATLFERIYDRENRPETYLEYENAKVVVELGRPDFPVSPNLWELLNNRRSKRNFLETPLSLNELNILLWGTQGITADMGDYQLRPAPSAGALYPIETFLLVNNVEGLEKGLYHLNVKKWCLEGLKMEDISDFSYFVTHDQEFTRHAAVNFVWTAVIPRTKAKYHERTYRYIWWDVGHIAENLHIVGNGIGLGACTIGHWLDKEMNEFLEIDGENHISALVASVGKIKGENWIEDRRVK